MWIYVFVRTSPITLLLSTWKCTWSSLDAKSGCQCAWWGWFDVDILHQLEDWDVFPFASMYNSGCS